MQSDYDSNLPPFFEDWGGRDHRTAAGPANRQKKLDIKYLSLPYTCQTNSAPEQCPVLLAVKQHSFRSPEKH